MVSVMLESLWQLYSHRFLYCFFFFIIIIISEHLLSIIVIFGMLRYFRLRTWCISLWETAVDLHKWSKKWRKGLLTLRKRGIAHSQAFEAKKHSSSCWLWNPFFVEYFGALCCVQCGRLIPINSNAEQKNKDSSVPPVKYHLLKSNPMHTCISWDHAFFILSHFTWITQ